MTSKYLWKWRFPLAAILSALALTVAATLFLPDKATAKTVVITQPVCAGCKLDDNNTKISPTSEHLLPAEHYTSTPEIIGKTAAVKLTPGTILQPALLLETAIDELSTGEVAFALQADDPAITGFSQSGQTVEIWGENSNSDNQLLAKKVRVLGVEMPDSGFLNTTQTSATVYLAAKESEASRVISAKTTQQLSFVLRG